MHAFRHLVSECDDPSERRGVRPRTFVVVAALAALLVGCSSSGDTGDDTSGDNVVAPETVDDLTAADTAAPADSGSEPAEVPGEEPSGAAGGVMTITTDLGESWTTEDFSCSSTPDETGPFAQLWTASATLDPDGQLTLFEANPPDPADDGTVVVGDLVDDAAGKFYVAIEASAVSDGSTLTITVGMHDSPLKIVGDPIDLTATVTCPL